MISDAQLEEVIARLRAGTSTRTAEAQRLGVCYQTLVGRLRAHLGQADNALLPSYRGVTNRRKPTTA